MTTKHTALFEEPEDEVAKGLCVECGDQPAETECIDCEEDFCSVCYEYLHRTGTRKEHATVPLEGAQEVAKPADEVKHTQVDVAMEEAEPETPAAAQQATDAEIEAALRAIQATRGDKPSGATSTIDPADMLARIREQSKYIPMRLTGEERKLLKLLEAALNVSEYTDKVDILSYTAKSKRIVGQLKEMCAILAGLVVAADMNEGKAMFGGTRDYTASQEWFKTVFEIGRRYKIMNPEKMRDSFGKLMYMIMDSRMPEVKQALEFDLYKPIVTVHSFLSEHGGAAALALVEDPLVLQAVVEIVPDGKTRAQIEHEMQRKDAAIAQLAHKHACADLPAAAIQQCLYSIGDYHAYLRANRHPVESILKLLTHYFDPAAALEPHNLGITSGKSGARLSHSHSKQFHYVHQSLTLWSHIMRDMFKLWFEADADLLSARGRYTLTDTGQGLNRVKACPSVARSMHHIINKMQSLAAGGGGSRGGGGWIGSSAVHLGDRAVPNALFFLDKYTQVPRILTPVYLVIQNLERVVARDPFMDGWIRAQFGSLDDLKMSKYPPTHTHTHTHTQAFHRPMFFHCAFANTFSYFVRFFQARV